MKKGIILVLSLLFLLPVISHGEKWQTVGARAMGMGGTGVASAKGFAQQYYNPAFLAIINEEEDNNDIEININAEIETTDKVLTIIDKVNNLTDKYKEILDKIVNQEYANAIEMMSIMDTLKALQELNVKDVGATVNANAGLGTKFKKIAVSVRSYAGAGVTPIVDKQNIGLVSSVEGIRIDNFSDPVLQDHKKAADIIKTALDKYDLTDSFAKLFNLSGKTSQEIANAIVNMTNSASSSVEDIKKMADKIAEDLPGIEKLIKALISGSYKDNESQVLIDAGVFTEVSVGYGYEIFHGIQVGGNLKYIQGQVSQTGIMILSDKENIGKAITDSLKDTKTTHQIGLDLGALIDVSKVAGQDIFLSPKFGITARNINNPYFDRPNKPLDPKYEKIRWNQDRYYLGNQLRAGIAVNPVKKLTVACDFDLMENKTFVKDFNSQEISVGAEYLLLNKKSFCLPLRAGINKNIVSEKSQIEYTFGTGFYTFGFTFEFAAGISKNTATFDGNKIPASVSTAFNLGYAF